MGQQANLRVQVLGVLAVAVDGREVPPQELASRKGRTLLKLLLARRGEVVPAEVLVEALWGARPPADPDANLAAEGLLALARTHGSAKYQALALARLGRRPEAAEVAAASGSDYLLAQVAPPAQARAAVDRIAAALPPELRPAFLQRSHLALAASQYT
jgi:hypothetical protein